MGAQVIMKVEKEQPLVSIVIPVYNAEKDIDCCLDSLLDQTYQNFEIICIDDGSTDQSYEHLAKYKHKDARIKVISHSHQTAGAARNVGLETAKGDYILFLDADDFFEKELLEKLVCRGIEVNADIVVCGGYQYNSNTKEKKIAKGFLKYELISEYDCFSYKDIPEYIFVFTNPAPWNKLFRRKFLIERNIRFQNIQWANDVYFSKMALACANRISCINAPLVNYRVGNTENLQSKRHQTPYLFLEVIHKLQNDLSKLEYYTTIEKGLREYFLELLAYEMRPYLKRTDRIEAFRKVCQDKVIQTMELFRKPASDYLNKENYLLLRGICYAYMFEEYLNNYSIDTEYYSDYLTITSCKQVWCDFLNFREELIQAFNCHKESYNVSGELYSVMNQYKDLNAEEQFFYYGLVEQDKICFEQLVVKPRIQMDRELNDLLKEKKQEINEIKSMNNKEIDTIRNSYAFRIGKTFTFFPSKIKRFFKR